MIEMGKQQELCIRRQVSFGVYLEDPDGQKGDITEVLLPTAQIPMDAALGDLISVFVYRDSEDRPIATTAVPSVCVGDFGLVTVKERTKIGAFCDWGLEKDLFLPYREMSEPVHEGQQILVRCYVDKSGRIACSMRGLYSLLSCDAPYQKGDEVQGRVYEFGHDFGTFVAVDDRFSGMLPRHEAADLHIGDVITARVSQVKPDGKLDLTMRKGVAEQMNEDAEAVLSLIESYAGVLPFSEKASPEVIFRETGLSKAAFKRAVGHLYRERLIELTDGRIRLKESESLS